MGFGIPQVITETKASGAHVIDGSCKFDGGYLKRTPTVVGNRKTWTFSAWVKFNYFDPQSEPIFVAGDSSTDFTQFVTYKSLTGDIALTAKSGNSDKVEISSSDLLRDFGWYHLLAVFDSSKPVYQTQTTIYVNGKQITRNNKKSRKTANSPGASRCSLRSRRLAL